MSEWVREGGREGEVEGESARGRERMSRKRRESGERAAEGARVWIVEIYSCEVFRIHSSQQQNVRTVRQPRIGCHLQTIDREAKREGPFIHSASTNSTQPRLRCVNAFYRM